MYKRESDGTGKPRSRLITSKAEVSRGITTIKFGDQQSGRVDAFVAKHSQSAS